MLFKERMNSRPLSLRRLWYGSALVGQGSCPIDGSGSENFQELSVDSRRIFEEVQRSNILKTWSMGCENGEETKARRMCGSPGLTCPMSTKAGIRRRDIFLKIFKTSVQGAKD